MLKAQFAICLSTLTADNIFDVAVKGTSTKHRKVLDDRLRNVRLAQNVMV